MPRIAWIDTGRPRIEECCRPAQSVHGTGISISSPNAVSAISLAIRRIVSTGMPQTGATAYGA